MYMYEQFTLSEASLLLHTCAIISMCPPPGHLHSEYLLQLTECQDIVYRECEVELEGVRVSSDILTTCAYMIATYTYMYMYMYVHVHCTYSWSSIWISNSFVHR